LWGAWKELGQQLEAAAQAARVAMEAETSAESTAAEGGQEAASHTAAAAQQQEYQQQHKGSGREASKRGQSPRGVLPGVQDLRGQWSGGVQAYGGGGGATNVDFNVRGQDWQWGDYGLDQV
jgi:hypothetical protein